MENNRNPNRSIEKLPVLDALSNFINFPKPVALTLIGLLLVGIGYIDVETGNEVSVAILYLAPVIWASWQFGVAYGLVASLISGAIGYIDDCVVLPHTYSSSWIPYWNTFIHMGFLIFVVFVLEELNKAFVRERNLSRRDFTTDIPNNKAFYERARIEIDRSRRYRRPLALAFLDCDNFKQVNDSLGHESGNRLLRIVAQTMHSTVRRADCVARIGGDEFVVLFPETSPEQALEAVQNVRRTLLDQMDRFGWPVTFSIGLATYTSAPDSVDAMLHRADTNMYAAKRDGKNAIYHDLESHERALIPAAPAS